MGYNRKQYLNQLVNFDFYGCNHIALCVEIDEDGKLICYRARKKRFSRPDMEVPVEVPEGTKDSYIIEYMCRFRIHPGCMREILFPCSPEFVAELEGMYRKLPPLRELTEKYAALKEQYYHAPRGEWKKYVNEMGPLAKQIEARQAMFLQVARMKKKPNAKYKNFRQVPNKNGIARIYRGGGCSGR